MPLPGDRWSRGCGTGIGLSAYKNQYRQGVTIENWVEDVSAMHNVGKNLLGNEAQGMASATTQRTDYNPAGKTGVELLENCIREDREPKPVVELEYTFPHGMPGHPNGFYDTSVNDLAYADPAVVSDKKKAAAKRAQAAAEMEGFDPYVTTSKTATDQGLRGVHERRSLIMPSSGEDGGQARDVVYTPVGRKAKGDMCEVFDKTYQKIGLRK